MNSKIIYMLNYIDTLFFKIVLLHDSAIYILALLRRDPGFNFWDLKAFFSHLLNFFRLSCKM